MLPMFEKLKDIFRKKEQKNKNGMFKICAMMLGGRRTGKTSVLAAMQSCFDDVLGATALKLSISDQDTLDVIDEKRKEIIDIYQNVNNSRGMNFTPDFNPTFESSKYVFDLAMTGTDDKFQIEFVDLPGEWFSPKKGDPNRDENVEFVADTIEKSNVFIIVIDTPYLMEDDGKNHWNENRNLCNIISQKIKSHIQSSVDPKLVLFVPLKCEKYRTEKKMQDVVKMIEDKECYGNLIEFLKTSEPQNEVVIAPIFTMGTAEFDHFVRDSDSNETIVKNGIPSEPLYYINDIGIKVGKPTPECCEQPLVCTIAYALAIAERFAQEREHPKCNGGIFASILDVLSGTILPEKLRNWLYYGTYGMLASSEKFMAQLNAMRRRLNDKVEKAEYGYKLVSDPLKFRM